MRIAEIFRSVQGEGMLTGVESIFVRVSGCNLRCAYCDTPYASWAPEGDDLSVPEILDRIEERRQSPQPAFLRAVINNVAVFSGLGNEVAGFHDDDRTHSALRHIVVTGGEPMLFAELIPLTARLRAKGWHVTIETSGTLYLPVTCDLMSISPKLSNSTPPPEQEPHWARRHTLQRHAPEVIRRLLSEYDFQLKFVIDTREDCREVELYLAELPAIETRRILLMPQGTDAATLAEKAVWLSAYCRDTGFTFCPRRQIEWFGAGRGR